MVLEAFISNGLPDIMFFFIAKNKNASNAKKLIFTSAIMGTKCN